MTAAALSELPKADLIKKVENIKAAWRRVNEQKEGVLNRFLDATVSLSGGAAVGVLRGYNDDGTPIAIPGTEVPVDATIAFFTTVAGIAGLAGKEGSRALTALGSGMGAGVLAHVVSDAVREARAAA